MKNWFITGASTGLGRKIAEAALKRGDRVCAASIDPENMQDYEGRFGTNNVLVKKLDVTSYDMCANVFAQAVDYFGHIDVMVNCAGFMQCGAVECMEEDEVRKIFDCNFFGAFFMSKEAARHMRIRRSGTIIHVASLSAIDVIAGESMYGATKMAVKGMAQALHGELAEFGVNVCILEPGPIRTDMAKRAKICRNQIPEYNNSCGEEIERWKKTDSYDMERATDPEKIAQTVLRIADCDNPPRELVAGSFAYDILNVTYKERLASADEWYEESASCDE